MHFHQSKSRRTQSAMMAGGGIKKTTERSLANRASIAHPSQLYSNDIKPTTILSFLNPNAKTEGIWSSTAPSDHYHPLPFGTGLSINSDIVAPVNNSNTMGWKEEAEQKRAADEEGRGKDAVVNTFDPSISFYDPRHPSMNSESFTKPQYSPAPSSSINNHDGGLGFDNKVLYGEAGNGGSIRRSPISNRNDGNDNQMPSTVSIDITNNSSISSNSAPSTQTAIGGSPGKGEVKALPSTAPSSPLTSPASLHGSRITVLFHWIVFFLSILLLIRLVDIHHFFGIYPKGFEWLLTDFTSALLYTSAAIVAHGLMSASDLAAGSLTNFHSVIHQNQNNPSSSSSLPGCLYHLSELLRNGSFYTVICSTLLLSSILLPALRIIFHHWYYNGIFLIMLCISLAILLMALHLSIYRISCALVIDDQIVGSATANRFKRHASQLKKMLLSISILLAATMAGQLYEIIMGFIYHGHPDEDICHSADTSSTDGRSNVQSGSNTEGLSSSRGSSYCLHLSPIGYVVAQQIALILMLWYSWKRLTFMKTIQCCHQKSDDDHNHPTLKIRVQSAAGGLQAPLLGN